jgi:hypothetical protein
MARLTHEERAGRLQSHARQHSSRGEARTQDESQPPKREERAAYGMLAGVSALFIGFGLAQGTPEAILAGFSRIISSTNVLITDYVSLGGIGTAFINAGLLMLFSVALLALLRVKMRGISIAAVFLMGSFGLFGKNIYNVWPIIFGTWLYARLKREAFSEHVYTALFATSLAPIVTEFAFVLQLPGETGALLGILVGVMMGLVAPPLAAHLKNVHKGFSLYNVGFTAGIIGTVLVSLLKSYGYQTGSNLFWSSGNNLLFSGFLAALFAGFVVLGVLLNRRPIAGLLRIMRASGQSCEDFIALGGFASALINMGINGLVATGYVLAVGGELNGPTIGGILTIAGFGAAGKHIRNIVPVLLGVVIGSMTKVWSINEPSVLLAALFGTSLAPVAGHYGWAWGIVAGFLNSSVALCSGVLHGGMNLYNTGFSAGIVGAFLVPLVEALPARLKRGLRPAPQEESALREGLSPPT